MKKIITIIFTLALILCLAACGNDVPVEETQPKATVSDATKPEVTEPEATEPDVTEPDVTEPEATEPEVTDPPVTEKPHAHSYTSTTENATCDKDGSKVFTCECGDSYTEIITKLGHSYTDKVTAPTCTEKGYTTHTCTRCSDSYKDSYKDATNHSYTSKVTTAASCTKEGVKTFTCSKCANKYTESIAKTAHNYAAATCTKPKTCTCGATSGTALGHSYTSKVTTSATCTKEGVKTFTCSKCANKYTESIAKTAHNYAAATCTKPKTCTCGATSGSALGHSYKYATNKAPTTSAAGTLKGTCSRCSGTTSVTVPKLNTTDYTRTQTKAPTCTATGTYTWKWKTTTYGTFSYTTSIAAKGHSWGSWKTVKFPNPAEEGRQERYCSNCQKKDTNTLAKAKYDGDYCFDPSSSQLKSDQYGILAMNICYAWWEDGKLKMECYIINGCTSNKSINNIKILQVENEVGIIGKRTDVALDGTVLAPGYSDYWHFEFSASQIAHYGSTLDEVTLRYQVV